MDQTNQTIVRPVYLAMLWGACLLGTWRVEAQSPIAFRYFYDDAHQLYRVLDSTGILLEYVYDASGNIVGINRSTLLPGSLSILNFSPMTGNAGASLTIEGQNFSLIPGNNIVRINGLQVTVLSASA